jgi:hypothetical protein
VLIYLCGIFVTYLAFGVALITGLDVLATFLADALESTAAYIVQAIIGAAMVAFAVLTPNRRPMLPPVSRR